MKMKPYGYTMSQAINIITPWPVEFYLPTVRGAGKKQISNGMFTPIDLFEFAHSENSKFDQIVQNENTSTLKVAYQPSFEWCSCDIRSFITVAFFQFVFGSSGSFLLFSYGRKRATVNECLKHPWIRVSLSVHLPVGFYYSLVVQQHCKNSVG